MDYKNSYVNRVFKVGDMITIKNCFCTSKIFVTRMTKLHAVCDVKRADGTEYTSKFKKEYTIDTETGRAHVTPVPRVEWNMNEYTVTPK